jgi:MFS family permease
MLFSTTNPEEPFVKESQRDNTVTDFLSAGVNGFRYVFSKPSLKRFSLNYAIVSSVTFFMFWFYQSLLRENAFPITYQGFVGAGINAIAMLMLFFSDPILKKFGVKKTLFVSSLVPGILYSLVFINSSLIFSLLAIFGVILFKLFRAPVLTSLINLHIQDSNRATVLSGISMVERILTTLFYPLAGILSDISLRWTFLLMGVITMTISVLLRVEETHIADSN